MVVALLLLVGAWKFIDGMAQYGFWNELLNMSAGILIGSLIIKGFEWGWRCDEL